MKIFFFFFVERMGEVDEGTRSIKLPVTLDIALRNIKDAKVQGHQFYMAVFFWYVVKNYLRLHCTIAYTGLVSCYKLPEKYGYV